MWQLTLAALMLSVLAGCGDTAKLPVSAGTGPTPELPAPNKTLIPTVNVAKAEPFPAGQGPQAAPGTKVNVFASGLDHPRWVHVLPNGDVLVAESNAPPRPDANKGVRGWVMGLMQKKAGAATPSANRITLLRDTNGDGVADVRSPFLENLNSPFGMALVGDQFFVANTDAIVRFTYPTGSTRIETAPLRVADLPGGTLNHHWTKALIASRDGSKLYATVGSNSNVAEKGMAVEEGRAAIWEVDAKTGAKRLFATGLRNPNGMAWEPSTNVLWTVVNERDEIGSDLVPDYMTSVRDGGFYGWPYSYFGSHVDERVKPPRPDLVATALVPDYALGPHTASLGLAWSGGTTLPAPFAQGMFIGQHGSWNRKPHSGYKVVFVPFQNGKPSGAPVDVLSGFLDEGSGKARGRPVGVALDTKGALLVADDVGNVVWRVSAAQP
ncbi:sorbosone dehydrogenase family protein [Piscinibacter sp. HJYY11]|uniref:PQQ-dependent sugar dehydrogenase n=1 Tax=Piscinibacter sp. HJYY11 TaxID=2801333 RepID=UPI00191DD2E8|nr:sorbosone dehydrogenase family protein [Piscinibacter sp. HJYY11]MBL0730874.1 sorbosone dehydrogenase family protein [Piscinibacter sp. HJYY11]